MDVLEKIGKCKTHKQLLLFMLSGVEFLSEFVFLGLQRIIVMAANFLLIDESLLAKPRA